MNLYRTYHHPQGSHFLPDYEFRETQVYCTYRHPQDSHSLPDYEIR